MAVNIRKTPVGHRAELDAIVARLNANANACLTYAVIANGTTAGRLRTTAGISYRVDGTMYAKSSTDDLWNLSAQATLGSGVTKAFWLYLDAAGTATIEAGTAGTTTATALAGLPVPSTTKSVIGVFVAGSATNFANALSSQGTIYHGIPAGAVVIPGSPGSQVGYASRIVLVTP